MTGMPRDERGMFFLLLALFLIGWRMDATDSSIPLSLRPYTIFVMYVISILLLQKSLHKRNIHAASSYPDTV